MDFLLDPNLAYLILLGGILLSVVALATPGSGFLEAGAVLCFALAGYAIYNLTIHWWALVILLLAIVPFVYAVRSRNKMFLGIAIALMVIGSVFVFTREGEWISIHPLAALLASSMLAVFIWFIVVKFLDTLATRPTHDLDALVGALGDARSAIQTEGSVYVNGELWSARSEKKIPAGSRIRVLRREGFVLIVEKVE